MSASGPPKIDTRTFYVSSEDSDDGTPTPADDFLELLGEKFPEPKDIVKSMAANGVLIYGQHALKTFFPEAALPAFNPLMFIAPDSEECLSAFMLTLEESGAVFKDIFEVFRDLLRTPAAEAMTVETVYVDIRFYLEANKKLVSEPDIVDGAEISSILSVAADIIESRHWEEAHTSGLDSFLSPKEKMPVVLNVGASKLVIHYQQEQLESRTNFLCKVITHEAPGVIKGQIDHNGNITQICIFYQRNRSPVQLVLDRTMSHTQCFLSAYGAAHLYYKRTAKRKTYAWRDEETEVYYPSDFTLITPPRNPDPVEICGMNDRQFSGAKLIPFEFDFDLGVAVERVKTRKEALESLIWVYDGYEPRQVVDMAIYSRLKAELELGETTKVNWHRYIWAFVAPCIFGGMDAKRDSILMF